MNKKEPLPVDLRIASALEQIVERLDHICRALDRQNMSVKTPKDLPMAADAETMRNEIRNRIEKAKQEANFRSSALALDHARKEK